MLALASVASRAAFTVSNTGLPNTHSPPLPGVTPPTTFVPYSIICSVWNSPSRPVMPCTSSLFSLSTRIAIVSSPSRPLRGGNRFLSRICQAGRADHVRQRRLSHNLVRFFLVRPHQPDDQRQVDLHLFQRFEDAPRHLVRASDPAEDVDQDRLHVRVAGDNPQRRSDLICPRAAANVEEVRRGAAE